MSDAVEPALGPPQQPTDATTIPGVYLIDGRFRGQVKVERKAHITAAHNSAAEAYEDLKALCARLGRDLPQPQTNKALPHSHERGVSWHARYSKWQAMTNDLSQRTALGFTKKSSRKFDTEAEAVAWKRSAQQAINDRNGATLLALAEADEATRGLPSAFLLDAKSAPANTAYVHYVPFFKATSTTEAWTFRPRRVVRCGGQWYPCCEHGVGTADACTTRAVRDMRLATVSNFCTRHGKEVPDDKVVFRPQSTAPGRDPGTTSSYCSRCRHKRLSNERKRGGKDLCASCEQAEADEAAAREAAIAAAEAEKAIEAAKVAGHAPPPLPAPPPAKKPKTVHSKVHEVNMHAALLAAGYVEDMDHKGLTPRLRQFTTQVRIDFKCTFKGDGAKAPGGPRPDFEDKEKKWADKDFVVCPPCGGGVVVLEQDENEHKGSSYGIDCDCARMINSHASVQADGAGDKHFLWLRVNPNTRFALGDDVKVTGQQLTSEQRCAAVVAMIDRMTMDDFRDPMRIAYCFYQMDADFTPRIVHDPLYAAVARACVLRVEHRVDPDVANGCELAFGTRVALDWTEAALSAAAADDGGAESAVSDEDME